MTNDLRRKKEVICKTRQELFAQSRGWDTPINIKVAQQIVRYWIVQTENNLKLGLGSEKVSVSNVGKIQG